MVIGHYLVVLHEDQRQDGEGQPHLPILLVAPGFINCLYCIERLGYQVRCCKLSSDCSLSRLIMEYCPAFVSDSTTF